MEKVWTLLNIGSSKILNIFEGFHFDINSLWIKLLLIILAILFTSFAVDFLLSRSVFGQKYRIFVAPGVILHELSHALFCILTGAKITKIALFDANGGSVEHSEPKIPFVGQIFISLAPFFVGIAVIFFMSNMLGLKSVDIIQFHTSFSGILEFMKSIFSPINFASYKNWFILYIVLSVAVTMAPSKQDLKNVAFSLIGISIVLFFYLRYFHFSLGLGFFPIEKTFLLLNTVVVLLILALTLSIIVFAASKLLKR